MKSAEYVLGIDYGTDSVRTVLVDIEDGREESSAVYHYPRWRTGEFCEPSANQFRQHPLDYLEGLEETVTGVLRRAPREAGQRVKGIAVDTTGSTPVAVDRQGTPLSLLPEFSENPNAMFVLWKDHTAVGEAAEINSLARTWGGIDFTKYEGGIYSSEWFWAKLLHILRVDPSVRNAAFSWVEHCDWIPGVLTGKTDPLTLKRSRCAAGHKAMWHPEFGGLPHEEFLVRLDPLLRGLRSRLYTETFTSDVPAGNLSQEWARRLGLHAGVVVGVGAFDAHMGAVGGGITPYTLTKIMGTSTCDMLVAPAREFGTKLVRGICGQVDGSIIPGMVGLEAGQSAFGDVFAWFRDLLLWPVENILGKTTLVDPPTVSTLVEECHARLLGELSRAAENVPIEESGILAIDWLNGRRTPDANQLLKGAIAGLSLASDAPRIFRALVEATAFGAKTIVDRFRSEGVRIDRVLALGGVAKKSPFVMQVVADVLGVPIAVPKSDQTCALGAAMFAATVAKRYQSVETACSAMESGVELEYRPNPSNASVYATLYRRYQRLGEFLERETMTSKEIA